MGILRTRTRRVQILQPAETGEGMKRLSAWLVAGAGLLASLTIGCAPLSMGIFTPVPVQPWVAERMEEKACMKNDFRTAILPPIPPGQRGLCEDPPDRAAILRALPRVTRGVPYF